MTGGVDVSTLLTTVKDDMLAQLGDALPIAGTVFAAIAGVMIGIKLFKRITGARS
jgi:hypothetical protein